MENLLKALLALGGAAMAVNEIRGFVLAAPALYALYQSGGTLMAWWLAFCALGGIALSVVVPWWIYRKVKR